ncbi:MULTISPECIES: maleylpyruvate isomerase family mycothiol-dependent enzyme [Kitasatospora]|uniref:Maleylpyruvate isomerase family mycothiol-dependent enzyme n=1 Tax=Kitasatospora cystarginea TaxID=58350 RepID=A0ABP5R4R7_9ACTN
MEPKSLLLHLRRELTYFQKTLVDGELSAPVEHCGDWTLHDLAEHMGGSNLWAAIAATEGRGDFKPPAAPRERSALVEWFEASSATLLKALDTAPDTAAWTFYPPHTVGFWQRRRCMETLVHRWDAEHAVGTHRPMDVELAGEGVAEVFDTMAPLLVSRGRALAPESALRLEATDSGASWTYGPGSPVATLAAPAEHLLLLLWNRMPVDGETFAWEGDQRAGRRILERTLTP